MYSILNIVLNNVVTSCIKRQDEGESPALQQLELFLNNGKQRQTRDTFKALSTTETQFNTNYKIQLPLSKLSEDQNLMLPFFFFFITNK